AVAERREIRQAFYSGFSLHALARRVDHRALLTADLDDADTDQRTQQQGFHSPGARSGISDLWQAAARGGLPDAIFRQMASVAPAYGPRAQSLRLRHKHAARSDRRQSAGYGRRS